MKKILEKYRRVSLRDKIVAFVLFSVLCATIGAVSGATGEPFSPFAATLGLCFVFEAFTLKFRQAGVFLVVAAHLILLMFVSMAYGSFNYEEYGYAGLFVALVYMLINTALFTLLAVRFSIGRLWLTLLLVYVAFDLGALGLMSLFGSPSMFFVPVAGVVALVPRCILWRGVFSRKKEAEFKFDVKSTERSMKYMSDLLSSDNGDVEVLEMADSQFGVILCEDQRNVWYFHPVHSRKPVEIDGNQVMINNKDYAPILHELYQECSKAHRRAKKRKKSMHVGIVLTNAKNQQEVKLAVAPKGYQRNKKLVLVLSPVAAVRRIERAKKS